MKPLEEKDVHKLSDRLACLICILKGRVKGEKSIYGPFHLENTADKLFLCNLLLMKGNSLGKSSQPREP